MSTMSRSAQAVEKMVKAEKALREQFDSPVYDSEKETQLATAVKIARDEFVDLLELLCPPFCK
jgi:hypothetical protein